MVGMISKAECQYKADYIECLMGKRGTKQSQNSREREEDRPVKQWTRVGGSGRGGA